MLARQAGAPALITSSLLAQLVTSVVTEALGEERAGNSAPAARACAGIKRSPTPSPGPPRPSAKPDPRSKIERAAWRRVECCV
jgi:hypothetical protein